MPPENPLLQNEVIRQSQSPMLGQTGPPAYPDPFSGLGMPPLLSLVLRMLLPNFMGNNFIANQFFPQESFYSQIQRQAYHQALSQAVTAAHPIDAQTEQMLLEGVAESLGIEVTPDVQQAIGTVVDTLQMAMPFLVQIAPDLVNRLHGRRGSAMVMASRMMSAGRLMVDPTTGRFGLGGRSAGELVQRMFTDLFSAAGQRELGIDAGRAGMLMFELQRRGLGLSGGIGTFSRDEQLRLLSEEFDISLGELEQLSREEPARFQALLRQFDSERVRQRIQDMVGAVNAMRDIFGDMGNPNAPMAQLISALQLLTQNNLAGMRPDQLEHLVRTTQMVARHTGMTFDTMLAFQTAGAAQADQLGLDRSLVPGISNRAALFGTAATAVGRLDIPAFGSVSIEQLAQRDQQLRLRAAASPVVQQMAVLLRAAEAGLLEPDSEAARYAERLRRDPNAAMPLTTEEWLDMLQAGGVDRATALSMLQATYTNQEAIRDYRLDQAGRVLQGEQDIEPRIATAIQGGLVSMLQAIPEETRGDMDVRQYAGDLSVILADALRTAPPEVQRDRSLLRSYLIQRLRDEDVDDLVDERQMSAAVEVALGNAENEARRLGYASLQEMLSLHNPRVLEEQQRHSAQVQREVRISRALSGLGRQGPLRRAISLFEDSPDDFKEALGIIFGAIDTDEVYKRVATLDPEAIRSIVTGERAAIMTAGLAELQHRLKSEDLTAEQEERLAASITGIIEGGETATTQLRQILTRRYGLTEEEALRVLAGEKDILEAAMVDLGMSEEEREVAMREVVSLRLAGVGGGLRRIAPDEAIVGSEEIDRSLRELEDARITRREEAAYQESHAKLIERFESAEGDTEERDRLAMTLRAAQAGGEAAYTRLQRVLKDEGLSEDQIEAVIRGESPAPAAVEDEVRVLRHRAGDVIPDHLKYQARKDAQLFPELAADGAETEEGDSGGAASGPTAVFNDMLDALRDLADAVKGKKKLEVRGTLRVEDDGSGDLEADGTEYGEVDAG